jgi:hypothetical protein
VDLGSGIEKIRIWDPGWKKIGRLRDKHPGPATLKKTLYLKTFFVGEYLGSSRYPPYAAWKIGRMQMLLKNRKLPIARLLGLLPYLACFLAGLAVGPLYNVLLSLL